MKDLRERIRELQESLVAQNTTYSSDDADADKIESFAREIRNDALDEALRVLNCGETSCPIPMRAMCGNPYHLKIRALKTDTLAGNRKGQQMKTLWIIHAPGTLAYQVCKDEEELSVPYVPRSEYEALQARVKELENQKSKMLTAHAKVLEMHIASDKTLHDLVKGLEEEKSRLRPCRGCPTVECTCLSELEDELLDKVGDLKQENSSLRKVVDAARNQVKLQEKNTVPSLIRAIRELDGGNVADMTLDGEKK